eukprot:gb/GECH01013178.1/.p1 GENE.gb/GECH01013178.1/~~gb/GECH01013178.1/.p1  ORF type:complete len:162 (+),score=58.28 gb/GECH01013178.1/:1-486(+)
MSENNNQNENQVAEQNGEQPTQPQADSNVEHTSQDNTANYQQEQQQQQYYSHQHHHENTPPIPGGDDNNNANEQDPLQHIPRSVKERELKKRIDDEGTERNYDVLNEKALAVIDRIREKLTGTDFDNKTPLDTKRQVNKLIRQATSNENLCQSFVGWCAFW